MLHIHKIMCPNCMHTKLLCNAPYNHWWYCYCLMLESVGILKWLMVVFVQNSCLAFYGWSTAGNRLKLFGTILLQFLNKIYCFMCFRFSSQPSSTQKEEIFLVMKATTIVGPMLPLTMYFFVLFLAPPPVRLPSPSNNALLFAIDATRPGVNAWQQPCKVGWTHLKVKEEYLG